MVKYDEINIQKQLNIMSSLINVNTEISNEFKAQVLIRDALNELKDDNNLDTFSIKVFVNNDLKKKWKAGNSDPNLFVKIFYNEMEYAKKEYGLTQGECGFLYSLGSYLLWECNLLVDSEGLPLNQKRLIKATGMGKTTISTNIKSLEAKKCLIRIWDGKEVYYLINPYIMWLGQNINKGLPKLFEMIGYVPLKNGKNNKIA